MDLRDLLLTCREFANLGWSVQEQLEYFADGGRDEDQLNGNAVRMIQSFMEDVKDRVRDSEDPVVEDVDSLLEDIKEYFA